MIVTTFSVEDGTGTGSSYVDLQLADDYHNFHGNLRWDFYGSEEKKSALVKATRQLDLIYGSQYKGQKLTEDQNLLFPRTAFVNEYGDTISEKTIPDPLKEATMIAALLVLNDVPLIKNPEKDDFLESESVSIAGAIEESKSYKIIPKTSNLKEVFFVLKPILTYSANKTELVRS